MVRGSEVRSELVKMRMGEWEKITGTMKKLINERIKFSRITFYALRFQTSWDLHTCFRRSDRHFSPTNIHIFLFLQLMTT